MGAIEYRRGQSGNGDVFPSVTDLCDRSVANDVVLIGLRTPTATDSVLARGKSEFEHWLGLGRRSARVIRCVLMLLC